MSGSVGWAAAAGVLFVQNGARQYFSYFLRTYHLNHSNCLKRKISQRSNKYLPLTLFIESNPFVQPGLGRIGMVREPQ